MVTLRVGFVAAAAFVMACNGKSASGPAAEGNGTGEERHPRELPPDNVDPGGTGPTYPGKGFRVHEWGTNTVVVGSDGSLQRGLHHEEEDLPSFVYDRTSAEIGIPSNGKMETPVAYFYSDAPLRAEVNVAFPDGILTQWYPAVAGHSPPVIKGKGDPVLDRNFPYSSPQCRAEFGQIRGGQLDWGAVDVLPRGAQPSAPEAPLSLYTWAHARSVDANAVRVPAHDVFSSQEERFLFYRGLGNFPIDVRVRAPDAQGGLVLTNESVTDKVGAVFVLRVEKDRAAFKAHPGGIEARGAMTETAPPATQPLDAYAQDLAKAMVAELDKAGLYHDESIAMVKTWARQWFRTPGIRVLYLSPRAATDRQIPLTIRPAPEELVRVMVIRMEILTPPEEGADLAAAAKLDGAARTEGQAYFASLGRFAEPRLRRAMQQMPIPSAGALAHLDAIAGADVSLRAGE